MILKVSTWQRSLAWEWQAMATISMYTPTGDWIAPDEWDEEETPESLMLWCLHGVIAADGEVLLTAWHSPVAAIVRSWH